MASKTRKINLLRSTQQTMMKSRPRAMLRWVLISSMVSILISMHLPGITAQAAGNLSITRTIQLPSADNFLELKNPDDNHGGDMELEVNAKSGVAERIILKFDIGSIPNSSNVSSATLSLYYEKQNKDPVNRTYWAYRITETDWVEGISTGSSETGASDWNHRQHDTLSWSSAGGTSTTTDGASVTMPASYGWIDWAVANQVQYAVNNGVDTHFLIKDSDETVDANAFFYSKEEDTQTTLRPKLSITFIAPWDSYQDSGRTTVRDTFNASYTTAYMKGTGFASGNYNVAYYDAGASGGQKVTTDSNISVSGDGILNSDIALPDFASFTAGTWHALVQPAGATSFPSTYNTAVSAPDTYDLLANDSFTAEESAFQNIDPTVEAVGIYQTDRSTAVTSLTPQTEYAVKVTVTDNNTLADLSTVKVTIFYDTDADNDPADVPGTGDTQNAAILTCTVNSTPSWSIDPSASTTWEIVSGNCTQPTLTGTSDDFWFHFKPGKVSTEALDWDAYAVADDGGGTPGTLYDSSGYDMNWYGEVTVNTVSVEFTNVDLGSDFSANSETNISVTYIANGAYNQQVKASSPWSAGLNEATLNEAGNPGVGQFSLKANDTAVLGEAVLVLSTATTSFDTGTQTSESGNVENSNTLWLKLGSSGIPDVTYSGTVFYYIAE